MRYKDVFISGIGIHSCLGVDIHSFTKSLISGKCGLHHDSERKLNGYQSDLCGNVPVVNNSYLYGLSRAQQTCLSQPSLYALSAVRQALFNADIDDDLLHNSNVSLIVSNDSTAEAMMQDGLVMQKHNDTRYLGAGSVFRSLNSTVSMNIASILGLKGLSLTLSAACAGGGHAIGLGKMLIENGLSQIVIVVGAQESNTAAMQSFDALGVFAAEKVCPFGKTRNGLAPSGGAACVILEEGNSFNRRRAIPPLARLCGYGFSSNGIAISTPSSEQEAAAMRIALLNAEVDFSDITAIMAHATGTPLGDKAEAEAINSIFQHRPIIVATKGMTGHECWMAGVSQAVQATVMIQRKFIPQSIGAEDNEFPLLNISHKVLNIQPSVILCNAFGFGGTNSSFIISKPY